MSNCVHCGRPAENTDGTGRPSCKSEGPPCLPHWRESLKTHILAIPPEPRITITLPREMNDKRVADMRSWAADIQAVFGVPVFVHQPYGVTYREWDALAADAYHMPDRTVAE